MMYSFKCPACGHEVTVDAINDDEAVMKINEAGAAHAKEVHADMPPMSDEEMTAMVRQNMMRHEEVQGAAEEGQV